MPPTTRYRFGDVVLVRFPLTDQSTTKNRPAIVVSSASYHRERSDLILMAVTSQIGATRRSGDILVEEWKEAGLLKPSVVKPVIATVQRDRVLRRLGHLGKDDRSSLRKSFSKIFG